MAPKAPSQTLEEPFKIFNRMATQSAQDQEDVVMQEAGDAQQQEEDEEEEELDEDRYAILIDVPLKPIQVRRVRALIYESTELTIADLR